MRGSLGSIPTWGNILSLDFFSRSKASDVNIVIIANFINLRKTRLKLNAKKHLNVFTDKTIPWKYLFLSRAEPVLLTSRKKTLTTAPEEVKNVQAILTKMFNKLIFGSRFEVMHHLNKSLYFPFVFPPVAVTWFLACLHKIFLRDIYCLPLWFSEKRPKPYH